MLQQWRSEQALDIHSNSTSQQPATHAHHPG
jgi:quinol monooxygenase YgiN